MVKSVWVTDGTKIKAFPRASVMPTAAGIPDPDVAQKIKAINPSEQICTYLLEELQPHDRRSQSAKGDLAVKQEL